jgi:hypothetical protein
MVTIILHSMLEVISNILFIGRKNVLNSVHSILYLFDRLTLYIRVCVRNEERAKCYINCHNTNSYKNTIILYFCIFVYFAMKVLQ